MLVSMTGFGAATTRDSEYLISSEIKAVNNRFLKTSIKLPDGFASLETKIDELLRKEIARGTVSVSIRIVRESSETDYEINLPALRRYMDKALEEFDLSEGFGLGTVVEFMRLPGVIQDKSNSSVENLAERLWNAIEQNLKGALVPFQKMRDVEGAATQKYLAENILQLREQKLCREGGFYDLMYANPHMQRQYAFIRHNGKKFALIIANFSDQEETISLNLPHHFFEFTSIKEKEKLTLSNILSGNKVSVSFKSSEPLIVTLPANFGIILS